MKIEQSNVTMKACHEFSSECEVNFEFESSFKSVLDGIAQTEETTDVGKKDEQARLLLMRSIALSICSVLTGRLRSARSSEPCSLARSNATRRPSFLTMLGKLTSGRS